MYTILYLALVACWSVVVNAGPLPQRPSESRPSVYSDSSNTYIPPAIISATYQTFAPADSSSSPGTPPTAQPELTAVIPLIPTVILSTILEMTFNDASGKPIVTNAGSVISQTTFITYSALSTMEASHSTPLSQPLPSGTPSEGQSISGPTSSVFQHESSTTSAPTGQQVGSVPAPPHGAGESSSQSLSASAPAYTTNVPPVHSSSYSQASSSERDTYPTMSSSASTLATLFSSVSTAFASGSSFSTAEATSSSFTATMASSILHTVSLMPSSTSTTTLSPSSTTYSSATPLLPTPSGLVSTIATISSPERSGNSPMSPTTSTQALPTSTLTLYTTVSAAHGPSMSAGVRSSYTAAGTSSALPTSTLTLYTTVLEFGPSAIRTEQVSQTTVPNLSPSAFSTPSYAKPSSPASTSTPSYLSSSGPSFSFSLDLHPTNPPSSEPSSLSGSSAYGSGSALSLSASSSALVPSTAVSSPLPSASASSAIGSNSPGITVVPLVLGEAVTVTLTTMAMQTIVQTVTMTA